MKNKSELSDQYKDLLKEQEKLTRMTDLILTILDSVGDNIEVYSEIKKLIEKFETGKIDQQDFIDALENYNYPIDKMIDEYYNLVCEGRVWTIVNLKNDFWNIVKQRNFKIGIETKIKQW